MMVIYACSYSQIHYHYSVSWESMSDGMNCIVKCVSFFLSFSLTFPAKSWETLHLKVVTSVSVFVCVLLLSFLHLFAEVKDDDGRKETTPSLTLRRREKWTLPSSSIHEWARESFGQTQTDTPWERSLVHIAMHFFLFLYWIIWSKATSNLGGNERKRAIRLSWDDGMVHWSDVAFIPLPEWYACSFTCYIPWYLMMIVLSFSRDKETARKEKKRWWWLIWEGKKECNRVWGWKWDRLTMTISCEEITADYWDGRVPLPSQVSINTTIMFANWRERLSILYSMNERDESFPISPLPYVISYAVVCVLYCCKSIHTQTRSHILPSFWHKWR